MIMFILVCIFHISSSLYNMYLFFKTNNHINEYIKTLNETELGDHNHNTFDASVLPIVDIIYYLIFIIMNIIIFKKLNNCCCRECTYIVSFSCLIINVLIRSEYVSNTNKYLNDKNLNFDESYKNNLILSIVFYYTSCGVKFIVCSFAYLLWYDN